MITIDINTALSSFAAVAGLVSLIAFVRINRRLAQWRERYAYLEASQSGLQREIDRVASISVRTGRQVERIDSDCSEVADRVDLVESRGPQKTLDQAIHSARRGADSRRLTQQFGLSRGEAELVARLHGGRKSA